jgi:2-oxoacid:acceptor oxidoreductase gamma subunit (pyruvate/2-ketoisovalerate family)
MVESFEPLFPLGNLKRTAPEDSLPDKPTRQVTDDKILEILGVDEELVATGAVRSIPDQQVKIAGFGGQGVISAGILLAQCAVAEGFQTTWLPSYGPEMRGGTANSSVNLSNSAVGSPIVAHPNVLLACNLPSLDSFEEAVTPGGIIMVNSSLVDRKVERKDVRVIYLPAADIANRIGVRAVLNVVLLAAYSAISGVIREETLRRTIPAALKNPAVVDANLQAIDLGIAYIREHYPHEMNPGNQGAS